MVADAKELAGDGLGAEQELKGMWLYFRNLRGDAVDTRAADATTALAGFYCDEGRWDDAAEMFSHRQGSNPGSSTTFPVRALAVEGRLKAHQGRFAEALSLLERAIVQAEAREGNLTLRAEIWAGLAEVQRAAGQRSEADAAGATALALYEQKGNIAAAARLRAIVGSR